MSRQCSYCKHYNTELNVFENVEFAVAGLCEGATIVGGFILGGLICGPFGAMKGSEEAKRVSQDFTKGIKRYHCNNCGRDFE